MLTNLLVSNYIEFLNQVHGFTQVAVADHFESEAPAVDLNDVEVYQLGKADNDIKDVEGHQHPLPPFSPVYRHLPRPQESTPMRYDFPQDSDAIEFTEAEESSVCCDVRTLKALLLSAAVDGTAKLDAVVRLLLLRAPGARPHIIRKATIDALATSKAPTILMLVESIVERILQSGENDDDDDSPPATDEGPSALLTLWKGLRRGNWATVNQAMRGLIDDKFPFATAVAMTSLAVFLRAKGRATTTPTEGEVLHCSDLLGLVDVLDGSLNGLIDKIALRSDLVATSASVEESCSVTINVTEKLTEATPADKKKDTKTIAQAAAPWRFVVRVPQYVSSVKVQKLNVGVFTSADGVPMIPSDLAVVKTRFVSPPTPAVSEKKKQAEYISWGGKPQESLHGNVVFPSTTLLTSDSPSMALEGSDHFIISSFGSQQLSLTSTLRFLVPEGGWPNFLRQCREEMLAQVAKALLVAVYVAGPNENAPSVTPLLASGIAQSLEAARPSIGTLRAKLMLREGDWQWSMVELVFAALSTVCGDKDTADYLQRRWRIEWVSALQGASNEEIRGSLTTLCSFVSQRSARGGSKHESPSKCAAQLHEWMRNRVTVAELEATLARKCLNKKCLVAVLDIIAGQCRQDLCDDIFEMWLLRAAPSQFIDALHGAGDESDVTTRFVELFTTKPSLSTVLAVLAGHQFDSDVTTSVLHAMSDRLASEGHSVPTALSGTLVSLNDFFTTATGVRASHHPKGFIEVERTSMGVTGLRGSRGWPIHKAETTLLRYFEVKLPVKHLKRALIGLCGPQDSISTTVPGSIRSDVRKRCWFVDSQGTNHCIPFGGGDVVGCGVVALKGKEHFTATLNGILLFQQPMEFEAQTTVGGDLVFPFFTYETTDKTTVEVNFGQSPFLFDAPRYNSSSDLLVQSGDVSKAAHALQCYTRLLTRSALFEGTFPSVVDTVFNKLPSLLIPHVARTIVESPLLTRTEASLCARGLAIHLLHRIEASNVADVTSTLTLLRKLLRRGTKILTSGPDVELLVRCVAQAKQLIGKVSTAARANETFHAIWTNTNDEAASISGNAVNMSDKQKLAHAVGTPLPRGGTVSFTVTITQSSGEEKSATNYGQFYIGVTNASVADLATGSWRDAKPPTVWAVHSISSAQLRHCNDAAFAGDSFTFGSSTPVTIDINHDLGTFSMTRTGKTFINVFEGIPEGIELRPFVQLVGEGTTAVISSGTRTAPISEVELLQSAIARLQRTLLGVAETSEALGSILANEMKSAAGSNEILFSTLGVAKDPSEVQVCADGVHYTSGTVLSVDPPTGIAIVATKDQREHYLPVDTIYRTPAIQNSQGEDDTLPPLRVTDDEDEDEEDFGNPLGHEQSRLTPGMRLCVTAAASAVCDWDRKVVALSVFEDREADERANVALEESQEFNAFATEMLRFSFDALSSLNNGLMTGVMQSPCIPRTHTFSPHTSSPSVVIPKHYFGKLALTPTDLKVEGPFVGISNEAIASQGIVNIRIKVELDWLGLISIRNSTMLPEGFYFGLCAETYHGEAREHRLVDPPDMWAVCSFDSHSFHLPHSCRKVSNTRPFFNRDTIRLEIDRDHGTMNVFRTPSTGKAEYALGTFFTNIPNGATNLFPFFQIKSHRASVMFLPESSTLPRTPHNLVRFATTIHSKFHSCDGCLNQLVDSPVEAPNWYRCNHCLNFDLCGQCFQNHFHCGHTFTHMRTLSFVPSPLVDRDLVLARNSDVEISSVPLCLLRSANCSSDPVSYHLVLQSAPVQQQQQRDSLVFAQYGLIRRPNTSAEWSICIEGSGDALRYAAGVCPLAIIEGKQPREILTLLKNQKGMTQFCVFSSCEEWDSTAAAFRSAGASKWSVWDHIGFHVLKDNNSEVSKNGSTCRIVSTKACWSSNGGERLCFFVLADNHPDLKVTVFSPAGPLLLGKVGEVNLKLATARATNGTLNRWCTPTQMHAPLTPIKAHNVLREGMTVFVAKTAEERFVECVVVKFGDVEEAITVHDGIQPFTAALNALFVPVAVNAVVDPDDSHYYPDVKRRLRRFYAKYAPTKTDEDMDKAIELYGKSSRGHVGMFEDLAKKYGPEPQPLIILPNSSKLRNAQSRGTSTSRVLPVVSLMKFLLDTLKKESGVVDILASGDISAVLARMASLAVASETPDDIDALLTLAHEEARRGKGTVQFSSSLTADACSLSPRQVRINVEGDAVSRTDLSAEKYLRGQWDGSFMTRKGYSFDVSLDCNCSEAKITFAGSGGSSKFLLRCGVVRAQWNALTQELIVALKASDDPEGQSALEVLLTERKASASKVPLTAEANEWMIFAATWDHDRGYAVGEWAIPSCGRRGEGTLRASSDAPRCTLQWALPRLVVAKGVRSTRAARNSTTAKKLTAMQKSLSLLASSIRLTHIPFVTTSPSLLASELATSLVSPTVSASARALIEVLLRDKSNVALVSALEEEGIAMATDATSTPSVAIGAALLLSYVWTTESQLRWRSLHAVVTVVHQFWNSVDALGALARITTAAGPSSGPTLSALLSPLEAFFTSLVCGGFHLTRILSCVADVFVPLGPSKLTAAGHSTIPIQQIRMIRDTAKAIQANEPVPACLDAAEESVDATPWTPISDKTVYARSRLQYGCVASSLPLAIGRYVEVSGAQNARVVLGLATKGFVEASKKTNILPLLGQVGATFGFDGTSLLDGGRCRRFGCWEIQGGETIGLQRESSSTVVFSVNGTALPPVVLPQCLQTDDDVLVIVQASRSSGGSLLRSVQSRTLFIPKGAVALHSPPVDCSRTYDASSRRPGTAIPIDIYAAVANGNLVGSPDAAAAKQHIANLDLCFANALPFIDLERRVTPFLDILPCLRRVLPKASRESLGQIGTPLTPVQRQELPQISVRWFDLYSHHTRSPAEALEHTVLAQLYRQIGPSNKKAFEQEPMFMTALMMTDAGHIPIDAGGPYSQVWSLLSEELMTDPSTSDTEAGGRRFHRNPLFRFASSHKGKVLIPDATLDTPRDLALMRFLGMLMGYLVKSKRCLAVEFSPVVWSYLTEEALTLQNFIEGVDGFIATCLDDEALLDSPEAELTFRGIRRKHKEMLLIDPSATRRAAAEYCTVHSLDVQLDALREGLWEILPRNVTRLMQPRELELLICGEPFPSIEQVRQSVKSSLPQPFDDMFWKAMEQLTPSEWSGFFYFASAQKRYPLSKKITVTPTKQSEEHIPQASTCFAHVSTPLYTTHEKWLQKLRQAISCRDMELA